MCPGWSGKTGLEVVYCHLLILGVVVTLLVEYSGNDRSWGELNLHYPVPLPPSSILVVLG